MPFEGNDLIRPTFIPDYRVNEYVMKTHEIIYSMSPEFQKSLFFLAGSDFVRSCYSSGVDRKWIKSA